MLKVDGELYKLPRLDFEQKSTVFRDMFSMPATHDCEGNSDENPIRLDSISKVDFERLLTVMFPR